MKMEANELRFEFYPAHLQIFLPRDELLLQREAVHVLCERKSSCLQKILLCFLISNHTCLYVWNDPIMAVLICIDGTCFLCLQHTDDPYSAIHRLHFLYFYTHVTMFQFGGLLPLHIAEQRKTKYILSVYT